MKLASSMKTTDLRHESVLLKCLDNMYKTLTEMSAKYNNGIYTNDTCYEMWDNGTMICKDVVFVSVNSQGHRLVPCAYNDDSEFIFVVQYRKHEKEFAIYIMGPIIETHYSITGLEIKKCAAIKGLGTPYEPLVSKDFGELFNQVCEKLYQRIQ